MELYMNMSFCHKHEKEQNQEKTHEKDLLFFRKSIEDFYRDCHVSVNKNKLSYEPLDCFPPAAPIRITPYSQDAEELNRQISSRF